MKLKLSKKAYHIALKTHEYWFMTDQIIKPSVDFNVSEFERAALLKIIKILDPKRIGTDGFSKINVVVGTTTENEETFLTIGIYSDREFEKFMIEFEI